MKLNTVTIKRRSSTSNITPTSPITATSTSTGVISTGETLSGATVKGINPFHSIFMDDSVSIREQDLLAASCTIDPKTLVTVQISSDSLSHASENCYLPSIPQAPLVSLYQSLQHKLEESENTLAESRKKTEGNNNRQILYIQNQQLPELKTRLNRVRNIHMSATTVPTILQFQPVLIAYQLTLMDSQIIKNISVDALLTHSPKRPHPSITVSTDFFNYLTRLIEHSILLHQDASGRAQLVNHWIKVAGKCHELKNYQTLKAVISALGTPPIQRLKRSWAFVPKKSLVLLEDLTELMSESCNYGRYRELLGIHNEENLKKWPTLRNNSLVLLNEPTVPFLGTFLHDMTYLVALQQQEQANKDDPRLLELLQLFKTYQHCPPYSTSLTRGCLKELNKHRKRKLSHALTRSSPMKKTPLFFQENDTEELSVEMQQCLVTQYLVNISFYKQNNIVQHSSLPLLLTILLSFKLTRSWVSEKTVDELSLVREPPKTCRSYSATDTLCPPSLQPSMTSSVSLTTSHQHSLHPGLRSSSGSLTASGSSTGGESSSRTSSRPMSLEDDVMDEQKDDLKDMKNGFWLFGRKSVDQSYLKATQTTQLSEPVMTTMGGLHRSPRHFSFDELNKGKRQPETMRIQREGSQGSFTLFRKDFWKSEEKKQDTIKPKTLTRRGSYSSLVPHQPNDSSSSPPPDQQRTYNTISPGKLKHALSSPHPLDASAKTTYNDSIMQWRQ
jgi:hypothetical protein